MPTPPNVLAVYSSKPALSGAKLILAADQAGMPLRFLSLGGYLCDRDEVLNNSLAKKVGLLLVSCLSSERSALDSFDEFVRNQDRHAIAKLLNGGGLPWCEFYVGRFDYASHIKQKPKDRSQIDGSVKPADLPKLRAAKARYILHNTSRRSSGRDFIAKVAELLASTGQGVVAKHVRPSC